MKTSLRHILGPGTLALLLAACGAESESNDSEPGTTSQSLTSPMDFGGMYGFSGNGPFINPYTGQASCPPGFTAYPVLGTSTVDWALFFCGRFSDGQTSPIADFGGAYGYGNGAYYNNPVTRNPSCPSGYLMNQTLGSAGTDYPIWYCHKPHTSTSVQVARFGGMYGFHLNGVYANPATGSASCPTGFSAAQVLGTNGVDFPVYFCWAAP